jgi:hypothetical protein
MSLVQNDQTQVAIASRAFIELLQRQDEEVRAKAAQKEAERRESDFESQRRFRDGAKASLEQIRLR